MTLTQLQSQLFGGVSILCNPAVIERAPRDSLLCISAGVPACIAAAASQLLHRSCYCITQLLGVSVLCDSAVIDRARCFERAPRDSLLCIAAGVPACIAAAASQLLLHSHSCWACQFSATQQ